jgi:hypothetical protein
VWVASLAAAGVVVTARWIIGQTLSQNERGIGVVCKERGLRCAEPFVWAGSKE